MLAPQLETKTTSSNALGPERRRGNGSWAPVRALESCALDFVHPAISEDLCPGPFFLGTETAAVIPFYLVMQQQSIYCSCQFTTVPAESWKSE